MPTPLTSSAIWRPARRPNTSRSTSEFVPSRFAPWTDTQAASPAAYSPGHDGARRVARDPRMQVGRDAAHRVVGGGLDRHRLGERLDALVDAGEVGDVGQLLLDDLAPQVADVEVDVVLAVDPAARADLLVDRPADHVARRQLHERRGVALHEPLALAVEEDAALAARRLGEQDADADDAGRVELVELHVLHRDAVAIGQRDAVAGEAPGVRGDPEHPPEAAGREQHRLRAQHVQLAVGDAVGDDARGTPPSPRSPPSETRSTTWYSS